MQHHDGTDSTVALQGKSSNGNVEDRRGKGEPAIDGDLSLRAAPRATEGSAHRSVEGCAEMVAKRVGSRGGGRGVVGEGGPRRMADGVEGKDSTMSSGICPSRSQAGYVHAY